MALQDRVIQCAIAALLAINVYFAAVEPCTSAEAVVYERYASHDYLDLWKSPLDPRLGLVYGALARLATRTGGVSELTIRIPAILGGLLFWIGLSDFCRRWARALHGWLALIAFLAIAANPWTFRAFSTATGAALAAGFLATAARLSRKNLNAASLLIGLAIGSDAFVAIPALAAAALVMLVITKDLWRAVDGLLLPGLVAGLFLLMPALLIRSALPTPSSTDRDTRELIRKLMHQPHAAAPVNLCVSPSIEPGAFFYRRRYHLDWLIVSTTGRSCH